MAGDAMERTKFTIRVPKYLLENAKRYAAENHTTLTDLITAYLYTIPVEGSLQNAPIVRRLSGTVSKEVSLQDYQDHLDEKYDR
jgi:hypothetical protein